MAEVLKDKELHEKTLPELREMAKSAGVKTSGNKDELIHRLVEYSYPVYKLPRPRATSTRGIILSAFVDDKGEPREVDEEVLVKSLVDTGKVSKEAAQRSIKLYKWNLVRYYGYTFEGGHLKKRS